MRLPGIAVVGAVTVGLGCATLPPCPARGGPAWSEYSSEHFELQTTMEAPIAKGVVRMLEETRAAMLGMVWGDQPGPPERTRAILLESGEHLKAVAGDGVAGFYVRRSPLPPTMVFAADTVGNIESIKHELAHDLSFWFLPFQPGWYSEGIATYLETIEYDRAQGRATVGEVSKWRLEMVRQQGVMNLERLMGPVPTEGLEHRAFECSNWLFVHYLLNHHEQAFRRFQTRLGAMEPSQQAWRAEFSKVDPAKLEYGLRKYSHIATYVVASRAIAPWLGEVRDRPMSDAEVHGSRAFLYSVFHPIGEKPQLDKARVELDEAMSAPVPPIDALALAFYSRLAKDVTARVALAQRAAATHADNWLSWIMVADSTDPKSPEHESALDRALDLAPDEREVLVRAAISKARQERWDEAVVFSTRALRGRAVRTDLWEVHLTALAKTGFCAEAEQWATTLVGALPPRTSQPIAALWATLKPGCVPRPPRAKPSPAPPPN